MRIQHEVIALYLIYGWITFCFIADVTAHPSEYQSGSLRHASSLPIQLQTFPSLQHADDDWSIYDRVKSVISNITRGMSLWGYNVRVDSSSPTLNSSRPSTLLERYGGDVVLRFNFSSVVEAEALLKAINVLLIDVWDFAERWVDVRLSKDVVSIDITVLVSLSLI